jgi:hypothetical protein
LSLPAQLTCLGCQLYINDALLIDIFEPILTRNAVAVTKLSPCVTLQSNVVGAASHG